MKKIFILTILTFALFALEMPNIKIPQSIKNLGKKTPIDIALYAKNSSTVCTLKIKNISNPYKKDISDKLPVLVIKPGRYYRANISNILKGEYEFEYDWYKKEKFIDSGAKVIHFFAYHDTNLTFHKRVNLTFDSTMPKECRKEKENR